MRDTFTVRILITLPLGANNPRNTSDWDDNVNSDGYIE